MANDLIIGAASNYTWEHLKYWVTSIRKTGYQGDVVLVATNIKRETLEKLAEYNVDFFLYGKKDENGDYVSETGSAPHVERFFYIWNFLKTTKKRYDFVIATDTRDVIFQTNPTEWYDDCLLSGNRRQQLIVASEGIRFSDEPWNNRNIYETFGPFFHQQMADNLVYNVGVIAGEHKYICDLMLLIFQMSINRPIPIVDQAVFNFLIQTEPYKSCTSFTNNDDAWAAQLGVTYEAVAAGAGDIGLSIANDPSKMILYQAMYQDIQPKLTEDGLVVNHNGTPFVIVHQYDRTAAWTNKIIGRLES